MKSTCCGTRLTHLDEDSQRFRKHCKKCGKIYTQRKRQPDTYEPVDIRSTQRIALDEIKEHFDMYKKGTRPLSDLNLLDDIRALRDLVEYTINELDDCVRETHD